MYKNILMIGCGGLGKALLYCLRHVDMKLNISKLIIIEPNELTVGVEIPKIYVNSFQHIKMKLTKDNFRSIFDKIIKQIKIDMIWDCSVATGAMDFLKYSLDHDINYINTSMEDWPDKNHWNGKGDRDNLIRHSLQFTERKALKLKGKKTAVLSCGMNPGLVEIFVKIALDRLQEKYKIKGDSYGEIAHNLGLETIHISEIDTQVSSINKKDNIFYNTWSPTGLQEEATDPIQLGWGSHEEPIEKSTKYNQQIILPIRSMDKKCQSFEPMQKKFEGYLIPHMEAATITEYLTHKDYRPSAYYVYKPPKDAIRCLQKIKKNKYKINYDTHIFTSQEIDSGYDSVGVLLLFKNKKAYAMHTVLDNTFAKTISPNINATMIQTACGFIIAIDHILNNPNDGVTEVLDLDHWRSFKLVRKLLGKVYCGHVPYNPQSNTFNYLAI